MSVLTSPVRKEDLPSLKDALDILAYDDPNGVRLRKLVVDMQKAAQDSEWAEEFLAADGLSVLLDRLKKTSGSVQGYLLLVLRGLLVYVNAISQVEDSPDLVERIYNLLSPPADGSPINLSVAKPTLEILIVICGTIPLGHKLVNAAAKHRIGVNVQPYSLLIPLLSSADLLTVRNTLLFMNILMQKRKECSDLKGKKLMFRWKECGLLSVLKPLAIIDDESIAQQLSVLQKQTNFTIPKSWEEAQKFRQQYEDIKRRYDSATESLFVYQQQQARMRLLKMELQRAQETIRALGAFTPTSSTQNHPTKRFADGGGIPLAALASSSAEPLDPSSASKDIATARRRLVEKFIAQPEFRAIAQRALGPLVAVGRGRGDRGGGRGRAAAGGRRVDPLAGLDDDDVLPPPGADDDDEDDAGPPPDDDWDNAPPPDDDVPPPADDDGPPDVPPPDEPPPAAPATSTAATAPAAAGAAATATAEATAGNRLGEERIAAGAGAAVAVPGVAASAPATPAGGAPPPPPPPPPSFKGIPPPPRFGAAAGGQAQAVDTRQFYKGTAPTKKMKPFHWDKLPLPSNPNSVWHQVYEGKVDCRFDYEEFEQMFSQKDVDPKAAKEEEKKEKKVFLIDSKNFQNISIMLHKLPTIPNIQRALLELDNAALTRDGLVAVLAQVPSPELKKQFLQQQSLKPVEQYEPPEQFVAMAITLPEFKRRCQAWLFTMEWEENASAIIKPITRMKDAIECVVESKYLPYYLGLLLAFGNMMNYGNNQKGNAPAIGVSTLSKLDAAKDNRGKVSLLQHLIAVVRKQNPDALDLHEELKPIFSNVAVLKMEDLDKSVVEAEKALEGFQTQVSAIKKALEASGGLDPDDPFVPRMTEFHVRASQQLKEVQAAYSACKDSFAKLLVYFGCPENKPLKPEELFAELIPFVEKIKKASADAAKEKKRQQRKGQKLDSQLSNVVGRLQEQMVAS